MAMTSIPTSRDAGFSALETLIAMLILAVGVTAMSTAFTEGRRVATEADRRQRAIWFAEEKLTEKLALGYDKAAYPMDPDEHTEGGNLVGEDSRDRISRSWWVEPRWSDAGVMRVVVVTKWIRRGERQAYQVAGLLARGLAE
jgi:prepilin-type N-terminal cleavage/methylation domain-containing protein